MSDTNTPHKSCSLPAGNGPHQRGRCKNESDMEFLLAHFSRAPQDLVLLMNGAEIVLYGEMVEANKEYHSIWGCKLPICNHDYIVYEIVSLKPCKDGLKNIVEIKEQYLKEEDKRIIF